MTTILRPLSTSELLDRTFHLYRNHFVMFVGIAAIPQVGVFSLHLVDSLLWLQVWIPSRGLRIALFYIASFVAVQISHAATSAAVSNLHLEHATDVWSAYSSARSSLLRVVRISFVAFGLPFILAVLLGILAMAVSLGLLAAFGIFSSGFGNDGSVRVGVLAIILIAAPLLAIRWWIRWALAVPVTVLEGGGLRTTMRRSRWLSQGRHWRIFFIFLLVVSLTWTVTILLQTPFYWMVRWSRFLRPAEITTTAAIVSSAGNFLSQSLVAPLLTIAFTLIYYDERVRKEGFDLQLMMAALQTDTQPLRQQPASAS
jgi:Membrane domain of glycerophosphoryl diester phosphodiesterase